jgi:hypothetical protein
MNTILYNRAIFSMLQKSARGDGLVLDGLRVVHLVPVLHLEIVKLLPLPQPPLHARTDARTNPSTQRATQLRSVLARVYAVSRQNQIITTVP